MTRKTYLDRVYEIDSPESAEAFYDDWAEAYDAELMENGYATPARVAAALARHMDARDAPILDFGCGTGLSGRALAETGFTVIDGLDLSAEMLAVAERTGVYRRLKRIEAGAALPATPGDYAAVTAAGVIGHGAAPLDVFDAILQALGPGGLFVFSFNDHTLEDPAFEGRVTAATESGDARLLERAYGDHIPAIGLKAVVYVLQKM